MNRRRLRWLGSVRWLSTCATRIGRLAAAILFGMIFLIPPGYSQPAVRADDALQKFAEEFWTWRARYQPFTTDDIPRIEHPGGHRDWSKASIEKQHAELNDLEAQWKKLEPAAVSVPEQVDGRLMGSAIARVHWELDVNRRWERDPTFYLDQTLTPLEEILAVPPPFDSDRSREILVRAQNVPQIIADAKKNLRAVRPFARLAIDWLADVRQQLQRMEKGVAPLLQNTAGSHEDAAAAFHKAILDATITLEDYRAWLSANLNAMPENSAIGKENYEFFLKNVALLPYTPEQLLEFGHQEWGRTVAFEQYEAQRNANLPQLKLVGTIEEQLRNSERDENAIRKFLGDKGILTIPPDAPHYVVRPMPDYLNALEDFGETDDLSTLSRPHASGTRWINPPSSSLGYFFLATAK